jgi:RND superfamily putative drug exporter
VRQIAAGFAAGVILDAVVVRMLLLPALVSLFGKANWWMPAWAGHLLRIPPSASAGVGRHAGRMEPAGAVDWGERPMPELHGVPTRKD